MEHFVSDTNELDIHAIFLQLEENHWKIEKWKLSSNKKELQVQMSYLYYTTYTFLKGIIVVQHLKK